MVIQINMNRILLFHKITHNPIIWSLMIWSFLEWYWKKCSYNLVLTILPILLSNQNFEKLEKSNSRSHIYSFIWWVDRTDFLKEVKLNLPLSKESIIVWYSNKTFLIQNNSFEFNELPVSIDKKAKVRSFMKAANNLWKIFSKMNNEKEIFYHLINY